MTVRAKADAVRAYSKAAKDRSLEIEAVAIRTVAERRLGQILAAERDAGRLAKYGGERKVKLPEGKLDAIGVTWKLSARAAKLAEPDDETFERDQAERVIVQANPPGPRGGPPDRGQSSTEGTIEPSTLRNMRQAHAGLTDEREEPSGTPGASPCEAQGTVSHMSVRLVCDPVTLLW